MLKSLRVSNLAVIEEAQADFAPGLNVITGETGAGKSVLRGALGLVLGDRADACEVRDGAKEAEIEAEFTGATRVVVRRTVTREGRSRAWIDDESVSLAELRDRTAALVDIHGPRANQRLLEEDFQRQSLDALGAIGLESYSEAFCHLETLRHERSDLAGTSLTEDELDLLRFQVNELEEAAITDRDDDLAERHAAAAHAEEILSAANAITEGLGGDGGAADVLARLQPRFAEAARHLPAALEWARRAEALTVELQELSRTVADAASALDLGEEDLDALDARLTVVNRLKRKYLKGSDAQDAAALLAVLDRKRARLASFETREARLDALDAEISKAEAEVRTLGAAVTKARQAAAKKLVRKVTAELRDLGFLQAKFDVALEAAEPSANGCDRVVYLFEPNPGEAARPLAAIASSGEIARVMLALKTVLAAHDETGTLVFDEIDANIGGEVGAAVGAKLRAIAKGRQVIAITHLPQSAVYGERHLVVAKEISGGRTRTTVSSVEGERRVTEIARMLGGEKITSVVRKHAQELIQIPR